MARWEMAPINCDHHGIQHPFLVPISFVCLHLKSRNIECRLRETKSKAAVEVVVVVVG